MSEVKVDKISPADGISNTTQIGDSGDTISLPSGVTLTVASGLGASSGGTGITSFSAGDLLYASGATTLVKLAKGTAGQTLQMNGGATAPTWTTVAAPATTDLNPLTKAVAILALRDSVTENLNAYNLNNSFIDTFQDSSGIGTATNTARQAGEFVKCTPTYGTPTYYRPHSAGQANGATLTFTNTTGSGAYDSGGSSFAYADWTTSATGSGWWTLNADTTYQNGGRHTIIQEIITNNTSGGPNWRYGFNKNDNTNTNYPMNSQWAGASTSFNSSFRGVGKQLKLIYDPASDENTIQSFKRDSNSDSWGTDQGMTKNASCGTNWTIRVWAAYEAATPSATGSLISTASTASSTVSSASLVLTYADNVGTATLNTDLKGYVSADNGSNWTQVTLAAGPTFSTGIKVAVSDKVTISNTGTQMKYKVEWANQSASKETRLDGASLNY
jgi:hypothetical protein